MGSGALVLVWSHPKIYAFFLFLWRSRPPITGTPYGGPFGPQNGRIERRESSRMPLRHTRASSVFR